MDIVKDKWKKNLQIFKSKKTTPRSITSSNSLTKSKSWHFTTKSPSPDNVDRRKKKKRQVAPGGCFSVYVGAQKQRFVVKTQLANHPLFKMLLEDAEREYGYNSEGPIMLPCDVDLFYKVLAEMDSGDDEIVPPGCTFKAAYRRSFSLRSPSCSPNSYRLLSPSRMLKMNQF